jgi:hypothetical protein
VRACVPAGLVAVLAMLALGSGPAAAAASAAGAAPGSTATCASGMSAMQAGNLPLAETIFGSMPQKSACARAGADLLEAWQLNKAGLGYAAPEYIERALEAEPTMTIPSAVLPMTVGPQGRALAETLQRDGYTGQARQLLLQVIENDPGIALDQADRVILGEVGPSALSRIWHFLINPIFLIVVALVLLFTPIIYLRLRRRLHFQPFDAGDEADAGPKPAEILRSLIRRELHRLAEESARLRDGQRLRIDQAGPYEDEFDLGSVLDSLPAAWKPLALATGALIKVTGSRSRLVTGMLLPMSSVIVEIRSINGVVKEMCTIKHQELGFPPPDLNILSQLALPAAAWIALTCYPEARLGGTRNWRSYVDFAAGCAWQAKGETKRARECYIRACNNPDNLAASVNLAALEQRAEYSDIPRDPASLPSYVRLSSLVEETSQMTEDLQWYRTRYLLSAGLRDVLDLGREEAKYATASANGHAPDPAMLELARRRAAELALELEKKIAEPGSLPVEFVAYGRAAALTLVARQVASTTSNLQEMFVDGTDKPDYNDNGAVARALRDVLDNAADDGTAERLVKFARSYCPLDDQAQYNLYRYHQTRASNLAKAIADWDVILGDAQQNFGTRPPRQIRDWEEQVLEWQSFLKKLYQEEVGEMRDYARQVLAAGDPALVERINAVRRLDPGDLEGLGDFSPGYLDGLRDGPREDEETRPVRRSSGLGPNTAPDAEPSSALSEEWSTEPPPTLPDSPRLGRHAAPVEEEDPEEEDPIEQEDPDEPDDPDDDNPDEPDSSS